MYNVYVFQRNNSSFCNKGVKYDFYVRAANMIISIVASKIVRFDAFDAQSVSAILRIENKAWSETIVTIKFYL